VTTRKYLSTDKIGFCLSVLGSKGTPLGQNSKPSENHGRKALQKYEV